MPTPLTAAEVISMLGLQPHVMEGGFFRETYRHAHALPPAALPEGYRATRSVSTAIYYMLTPETFSAMHRLPTDEVFHHYLGDAVEMLQLHPNGEGRIVTIGPDLQAGHQVQVVVPAGIWQGSRLTPGGRWALMGCTVAPGFDYADYEAGQRKALTAAYPAHRQRIEELTRE